MDLVNCQMRWELVEQFGENVQNFALLYTLLLTFFTLSVIACSARSLERKVLWAAVWVAASEKL